jgi:hypothetical protein
MKMEITFNVLDYLTPDEIKEECKKAIRHSVHDTFAKGEGDVERLISNLGYEFIFKAVSAAIGKDAEKAIADTVQKLASDKSHIQFLMWRRKDAWERSESPAIGILEEAIRDNKLLIRECVQTAIKEFEIPDVRDAMYAMAQDIIYEKLFGGAEYGK